MPRSESGLTCRSCYAKQKGPSERSSEPDMSVASEAPDIPDFAEVAGEPPPPDDFGGMATPVSSSGERVKFSGAWTCATCGGAITSLPFTPRNTSNLKCLDCFKQSKG